ncbi:HDOD domain-containing protein [Desulfolithobacter sp.]
MPLKLFSRIRRHAAISTGNFETLFKDIKIAPLPVAIARLLDEINRPDAEMEQISRLIGSLPEISAQVLKTVNSSLFSLRSPVLSIQHAVSLLGLTHIRSIALSFAAIKAIPRPENVLFDHQAFWSDSLIRALVARSFSRQYCPEKCDDAFTAMLIADVALPVLLTSWSEYYLPVVEQWRQDGGRLSDLEKRHFGWTHAQAGAWILQYWKFPEELVCYVGIHNSDPACLEELQLEGTIALPLMISSLLPSSLHQSPGRAERFLREARERFGMDQEQLKQLLDETEQGFEDIYELVGLCQVGSLPFLEAVRETLTEQASP